MFLQKFAVWLLLGFFDVARTLQWTHPSEVSDGGNVPVCDGEDVVLPWSYSLLPEEHIVDTEWYFKSNDSSHDTLLATQITPSSSQFFIDPNVQQNLEHVPPAGIRLIRVTHKYKGTYSVHVNVNLHGSIVTYKQSVRLYFGEPSMTADGDLHAEQLNRTEFLNSTQQHHILLACGHFKSNWMAMVKVVWTTPDNQTLPSTSKENGQFILAVPNPVVSGDYACHLEASTYTSVCLPRFSPLRGGAKVLVDGCNEGLAVLTATEKELREQIHNLQGERASLQAEKTAYKDLWHGVRLVNGSNPNEGRVEVWHSSQWGTVCDNTFGARDAQVVCEQLGLPSDNAIPWGEATFGQGAGPLWMDDVICFGSEKHLADCQFGGFGKASCRHAHDAGVTCGAPPIEVRLSGGSTPTEGRVEVRVNRTWGTVCHSMTENDAKVVCNQLGLPSTRASVQWPSRVAAGKDPAFKYSFNCGGRERNVYECISRMYLKLMWPGECDHSNDAGVICA